jgi:hypothetical protein
MTIPPTLIPIEKMEFRGDPGDSSRKVWFPADAANLSALVKMDDFLSELGIRVPGISPEYQVGVPEPTPVELVNEFHRRGSIWDISFAGEKTVVRHSIGMKYIALLLSKPDHDIYALDLDRAARYDGTAGSRAGQEITDAPLSDRGMISSAATGLGPLLDDQAKKEYRAHLQQLGEEYKDATYRGDLVEADRVERQREMIINELKAATGFGGRNRTPGSPEERARSNVQKAIKRAISGIGEVHSELARHLGASIRTGNYCEYRPPSHEKWSVRP